MSRKSGTRFCDGIKLKLLIWRMFLSIRRFHLIGIRDSAVAGIAFTDHRACGDVEGREKRGCPVALVIVALPCRLSWAHRQHRLAAVERLDLRFLVNAQHNGMGGPAFQGSGNQRFNARVINAARRA